ncbi:MAG: hypothetical protein QOK04_967 [Solirubrobacteraceae bacterium]|jgi:hypothetical protein|nr:hypothetical protein [Solirubrobacteraceae bacterium]
MTISAPKRDETAKRTELDERTRRAWTTYRDSLRDLSGKDYDDAERRSWDRLQRKLTELEGERAQLGVDSTGGGQRS